MNILAHKRSGIYAIVNTHNGHRYVGSAININNRWGLHRRQLRNGVHHSAYLQRAWNKYGEDSFDFIVLREVGSKADLIQNEQDFIDKLHPEYNVCQFAGNTLGYKHTDETRERLVNNHKGMSGRKHKEETIKKIISTTTGRRPTMETIKKLIASHVGKMMGSKNPIAKTVYQFSLSGEFIREYGSNADAERETGICNSAIAGCARGKRKTAGGYLWRYQRRG